MLSIGFDARTVLVMVIIPFMVILTKLVLVPSSSVIFRTTLAFPDPRLVNSKTELGIGKKVKLLLFGRLVSTATGEQHRLIMRLTLILIATQSYYKCKLFFLLTYGEI